MSMHEHSIAIKKNNSVHWYDKNTSKLWLAKMTEYLELGYFLQRKDIGF